jgi:hypothetical protein
MTDQSPRDAEPFKGGSQRRPFLRLWGGRQRRLNSGGRPGHPRTTPAHLLGDKGYSSRANRHLLAERGIVVTIPERADLPGTGRGDRWSLLDRME